MDDFSKSLNLRLNNIIRVYVFVNSINLFDNFGILNNWFVFKILRFCFKWFLIVFSYNYECKFIRVSIYVYGEF